MQDAFNIYWIATSVTLQTRAALHHFGRSASGNEETARLE